MFNGSATERNERIAIRFMESLKGVDFLEKGELNSSHIDEDNNEDIRLKEEKNVTEAKSSFLIFFF